MKMVRAAAFVLGCAGLSACSDQGEFSGSWKIDNVVSAPWTTEGTMPDATIAGAYVGRTVAFEAGRIDGPELLACTNPSYKFDEVPAEGLFQGALAGATVDTAVAEARAKGLGFSLPVRTMTTGCEHDIAFHMRDPAHAAFALDNMIFWMTKAP